MNGFYRDRDLSEVKPLAEELYDSLQWFFSNECAEVNKQALGAASNRFGYINAYVCIGDRNFMELDPISNWKRGCSFWGGLRKEEWRSMSKESAMRWCENKAKEILHIREEE